MFFTGGCLGVALKYVSNRAAGMHWTYRPTQYFTWGFTFATFFSYIGWMRRVMLEESMGSHEIYYKIGEINYFDQLPDHQFEFAKDDYNRLMKKYSI